MLPNRMPVSAAIRAARRSPRGNSRRRYSTGEIAASFSFRALQPRCTARNTRTRGIHRERFRMHGRKYISRIAVERRAGWNHEFRNNVVRSGRI
jgi:hypothetical protein